MHHFFVINPIAGNNNSTDELSKRIHHTFINRKDTYEIYITTKPQDAVNVVRDKCVNYLDPITFYACGGEGTSFEVLNGMINAPQARLTVIPIGSCNDFLKQFPNADFNNIDKLIDGNTKKIDCLYVNNLYALNTVNIGFDACVNETCSQLKEKYHNIKKAYNKAIIKNIFRHYRHQVDILSENYEYHGKILLLAITNGQYYGGGYRCSPNSSVYDNYLDLLVVKTMSYFRFLRMFKKFKNGDHVNEPSLVNFVDYYKHNSVIIRSKNPFAVCIDGENYHYKEVKISVIPQKIAFVFPKE